MFSPGSVIVQFAIYGPVDETRKRWAPFMGKGGKRLMEGQISDLVEIPAWSAAEAGQGEWVRLSPLAKDGDGGFGGGGGGAAAKKPWQHNPEQSKGSGKGGDDKAVPKPTRPTPLGPRQPGRDNDGTAAIGCTDDDAKETETDAVVEMAATATNNKTVDATPNAEER